MTVNNDAANRKGLKILLNDTPAPNIGIISICPAIRDVKKITVINAYKGKSSEFIQGIKLK